MFPRLCAHFWPVESKAVSGPFDNGHHGSNIVPFGAANRSGHKGRGKSGGVKENHRAIQSLIHQPTCQPEYIWISKSPAAKKNEPDHVSSTGHKPDSILPQIMIALLPGQCRPDDGAGFRRRKQLLFRLIYSPKTEDFTCFPYTKSGAEANIRRTLTS
jgi:hypothetical protein